MDPPENDSSQSGKTFGERWNDMYDRLVRFKDENGHCLVPNRYAGDKKLGAWVSAQRRHYKILTSGKKESTPMTLERAQKLIDIGFDWSTSDPRHVSWEDRFDQLKNFKKKYGHVQVPMGWDENPSLSNWVSAQRQDYKLFQKGRPSRLTQQKVNLLNMLGFIWEAQRGGRRRKLEPLNEEDQTAGSPSLPPAVQEAAPAGLSTQATAPLNQPAAAAAASTGASQASTSLPQLHSLSSRLAGNTGMLGSGLDNNMSPADLFRSRLSSGVNNSSLLDGTLLGGAQMLTPLQQQRLQLLAQLQSTGNAQAPVSGVSMLGRGGADTLMGHPALNASTELALRLRRQRVQDEAFLRDRASLASLAAREGLVGQNLQPSESSVPPYAAAAGPESERATLLRTALAATNKRAGAPPSRAEMLAFGSTGGMEGMAGMMPPSQERKRDADGMTNREVTDPPPATSKRAKTT